jgi:choline dehydrogenase
VALARMYDYVIVGAGSAGCVLASRLTEDPNVSVLLLEAGPPDEDENIHVPIGYLRMARSEYDWGYRSAPEAACDGRSINLPRGRVLGGSSSVNAMIYIRGNALDYDSWKVPGWSWRELLPYFLRAERNGRGASAWHGADGPLHVSDPRSPHPISEAFVTAGEQAGLARNGDFNGPAQDGVGMFQLTQREGMRDSAADAYLRPALGRENLTVLTGASAERILVEDSCAVGVRARHAGDGEPREHAAAREVIVCAGAYNSPQLLMLSGVGPAAHLRSHGIDVVHDAPAVGENLAEHVATEALWTSPEPDDRERRRRWRSMRLMLATQAGAFASALAEAGAFARSTDDQPAPDIQLHGAPVYFLGEDAEEREAHGVWVSPCLLAPASRGTVRLASSDPARLPIVHNAFLTAEGDLRRLLDGLRLALKVCAQPGLAPFCSDPFRVPRDDTERALREHIAQTAFAFYHPVGTCRMGEDEDAVVDAGLRVRGVEGLRVVDASVMPTVPRGNINAPTIAIAERAADLIRSATPEQSAATEPAQD